MVDGGAYELVLVGWVLDGVRKQSEKWLGQSFDGCRRGRKLE